jgi:hypothetical protein
MWSLHCTTNQHLGQLLPKPVAGLSTEVVNDKGRYHSLESTVRERSCRQTMALPSSPLTPCHWRGEDAPNFLKPTYGSENQPARVASVMANYANYQQHRPAQAGTSDTIYSFLRSVNKKPAQARPGTAGHSDNCWFHSLISCCPTLCGHRWYPSSGEQPPGGRDTASLDRLHLFS